jgi:hypothetical protein
VVVEHELVTTLESTPALSAAATYLSEGGFVGQGGAVAVGQQEWTTLDMTRGKKNVARAKNVAELPQRVLINFDRGRVTVAASIQASQVWGGGGFAVSSGSVSESPKKMGLHRDLLLGIVSGLELAMTAPQVDGQARAQWVKAEAAILAEARKRSRRMVMALIVIVALFAGVIALIAIAAHGR